MSAKTKKDEYLDIMDSIDDINPYATYLSESALSNVDEWIDTGSMVLNALISGSVYKGIPMGRVSQICGPSQCLTGSQKVRVYRMRSNHRTDPEKLL